MNLVPDIAVLFDLDDRRKRLDYRKVPLMMWTQLEERTELTPRTLISGLEQFSVKAIVATIWLERVQRERKLSYQQVLAALPDDDPQFDLHDIIMAGRSLLGGDDDGDGDVRPDEGDTDPPTGTS